MTASYGGNGHTITLENVLFGEGWVCGGQSNMEYTGGVRERMLPTFPAFTPPPVGRSVHLSSVTQKVCEKVNGDCSGVRFTLDGFKASLKIR